MVGLFKSNVYRPSGLDLLKVEFLIWLKGVNLCGVLFCGCFFLWELIGQSAKSAKIRTRKIFMVHGIYICDGDVLNSRFLSDRFCNYKRYKKKKKKKYYRETS